MSDERKPCPFCGATDLDTRANYGAAVVCNRCRAEGPYAESDDDGNEAAIAAWNTRDDDGAQMHARFLEWRGVDVACDGCNGTGMKAYGSTATWHGGCGGAAITSDTCNDCWGTGDKNRHGANLRKMSMMPTADDGARREREAVVKFVEDMAAKLSAFVSDPLKSPTVAAHAVAYESIAAMIKAGEHVKEAT